MKFKLEHIFSWTVSCISLKPSALNHCLFKYKGSAAFSLNVNIVEAEQVHTGTVHSVVSVQHIELRRVLSDDLIPSVS